MALFLFTGKKLETARIRGEWKKQVKIPVFSQRTRLSVLQQTGRLCVLGGFIVFAFIFP